MIEYAQGDLFANLPAEGEAYIPHIVNTVGAWGAGFVVPLGRKFPMARDTFLQEKNPQLGKTQFVDVADNIVVANMFAQEGIGFDASGNPPIRYNALEDCMVLIRDRIKCISKSVKIITPPFGSGLAGGDWKVISEMIERIWVNEGIPVTICYLPPFMPPAYEVVCVKVGDDNGDLELNKTYKAFPDASAERVGCRRVVDESGEDYLYPKDFFVEKSNG